MSPRMSFLPLTIWKNPPNETGPGKILFKGILCGYLYRLTYQSQKAPYILKALPVFDNDITSYPVWDTAGHFLFIFHYVPVRRSKGWAHVQLRSKTERGRVIIQENAVRHERTPQCCVYVGEREHINLDTVLSNLCN